MGASVAIPAEPVPQRLLVGRFRSAPFNKVFGAWCQSCRTFIAVSPDTGIIDLVAVVHRCPSRGAVSSPPAPQLQPSALGQPVRFAAPREKERSLAC
jgi:hypothetical protein